MKREGFSVGLNENFRNLAENTMDLNGNIMDSIEISLERVVKEYGGRRVIDGLSYRFLAGSRTAIVAPSGVGKTTLLRMILGLEQVDRGRIWYQKELLASAVFQEDRLFAYASPFENIRAVLPDGRWTDKEIRQELSYVGLLDAVSRQVALLSGGMKRRTAIVRAVLMPGNLLVMDEPFKGLDEGLKRQVMDYVKERIGKRTFLFVTHELEEARYFGAGVLKLEGKKV